MIRSRARLAAAVLIIASAAAFAICISVERHVDAADQSPATSSPTAPDVTTAPGAPTLGSPAGQGDPDGGHDQVAGGGDGADSDGGSAAAAEPASLLFGVNLESTGLVATVVVVEILLAVAILMVNTAWLPAVIALVMLGFGGILGAWEILHQLEQFRFELAAVATTVALLHVLAAVAAYLARTGRVPEEAR